MRGALFPGARIERVDVSPHSEEELVMGVLMLGAEDALNEVLSWYRSQYSEIGHVSVTGKRTADGRWTDVPIHDQRPWAHLTVRVRAQDRVEGALAQPYPLVRLTRGQKTNSEWALLFGPPPRRPGERPPPPGDETKILLLGDFPEPEGAKRQRASVAEQEGLITVWRTRKREFLRKEEALDRLIQSPEACLENMTIQDGLQVGYVTLQLTLLSAAEPSVVAKHFEETLAPLGELQRRAAEAGGPGTNVIELDQGGPYRSTVHLGPVDRKALVSHSNAEGVEERLKAQSRIIWGLQRRAPWLAWQVEGLTE
jgi:hypothetical protein